MAKHFIGAFPNPRCTGTVHSTFYSDDEAGLAQAEAFAQRENKPGFAVYDAVNMFRDDAQQRNKGTVDSIIRIACDIDLKDIDEEQDVVVSRLTSLPYPPSEVRASGHGVHAIWNLKEAVPVSDAEEAAKVRELRTRCTTWLCADPSIDHDAALLRRPGTTNSKDPANPVACTVVAACGATYDPGDVTDLLDDCAGQPLFTEKPKPEEEPTFRPSSKGDGQWKEAVDIDAAFASIVDGKTANAAQSSILASLLMRGSTPDEAIERTVDGTMEAADRLGLGWDREFEALEVRKRLFSTIGFLQDQHDWSETGELPPWMPAELQDAWVKGVVEGRRVRVCNNGADKLHVRTWIKDKQKEPKDNETADTKKEESKTNGAKASKEEATNPRKRRVVLKPFTFIDPKDLPPRSWLYAGHLQRRVVSADVAPGGVGKTSKALVEAIALATARNLLGEQPTERCRVWAHNGEDSLEELNRRVLAICEHYCIDQKELEGWLFLTSGTEMPLKVANGYNELKIDAVLVAEITDSILSNEIDLLLVDPLVTLHGVPESDNGKMDQVIRIFTKISDTCNCSVNITHHTRKLASGETTHTSDDARGASAIRDAVRSLRVLNVMTLGEAQKLGIDEYERLSYFRVDMGKNNTRKPAKKASWYKFENVTLANGDDVGVVTAWDCPSDGAPETNKRADSIFLAMLDRFTRAGQHVNNTTGIYYAPLVFSREPEARKAKFGREALQEAMNRLFDAGTITTVEQPGARAGRTIRAIVRARPDATTEG